MVFLACGIQVGAQIAPTRRRSPPAGSEHVHARRPAQNTFSATVTLRVVFGTRAGARARSEWGYTLSNAGQRSHEGLLQA